MSIKKTYEEGTQYAHLKTMEISISRDNMNEDFKEAVKMMKFAVTRGTIKSLVDVLNMRKGQLENIISIDIQIEKTKERLRRALQWDF